MEKPNEERYLTTGEAAKFLGVSYQTIKKLIRTGEIQAVVFPGMKHRRVAVSELRMYEMRGECRG